MKHRRIAVRTHNRRWLDVLVETRPCTPKQPIPAPVPPVPPAILQPRRFRMERSPDGQPTSLERIEC